MPDLEDGETVEVKGSAASPYVLRNVGGVYSCTCPAWRNQNRPPESRTCKHLKTLRGAGAEEERLGSLPSPQTTGAADEKAPPLLLAQSWDNEADLTGWWMSEKLDGVRAYWDGERLYSRLGNVFHAPDWFLQGLPRAPLDGELWGGRGQFQSTVSVVRRQDAGPHWNSIRYVVFDLPAVPAPFEERQKALSDLLLGAPHHLEAHAQTLCQGLQHLRDELKRVESLGGEGLMLRQPRSRYETGRSWTLLKVKSFFDGEAMVVSHQPGAGRHAGRLGALVVQLADGKQFSVGTGFSDAERENPPAVGTLITFRYQELSNAGIPRFPSFVGLCQDKAKATALCCFCAEAVLDDPVQVVRGKQTWQGHFRCFESRLHG